MNLPSDSVRVQQLLETIDQSRPPHDVGRRNIEQRMWAAFEDETARSAPAEPYVVTLGGDSLSIIGSGGDHTSDDGSGPGGSPDGIQPSEPKRTRRGRLLLLVAAAALVVLAIPVGARLLDRNAAAPQVASSQPEVLFTATVGEVPISFTATEPASLGESGVDFLVVQATNATSYFEASADSATGQIVIARPTEIFDGEDPQAWFTKYGLQVEEVAASHLGQPVPAWNVVVPEGSAADRDCDPRSPCLQFAQLASGRRLSLEQGFELNRIRLLPVEGSDRPMLVFYIFPWPPQGPTEDSVARLGAQVLSTLRLGEPDCTQSC